MSLRRYWTPKTSAALCALLVAATLAVRAAQRALVLEPLPTAPKALAPVPNQSHPPVDGTPAPQLIQAAIDHDVFRRERRRAPERFRLPGEGAPGPGPVPAPPVTPALTLIGTAVIGEGKGFAMCQRAGEPAKLVRVGEHYGDVTLREVAPGRALFRSKDGSTMELRVTKAGT